MSFGDPNNPYGQQQQPQQPGYGYPQGQQPGYGYPQAPPVQQPYGGGYPGGAMEMPGGVKATRVMLWVIAAFQIIGAIIAFAGGAMVKSELENSGAGAEAENLATGLVVFVGILALIFAAISVTLALKVKSGGNATRICTIVYGAFIVLGGIFQLPLGIVSIALGVLIIVFVAKSDGAAWFQRPRY
ncbi:hypothetical protein [Streptomyces purpureus]|uniref:hypothetical protein n=1 Tax=Streptomyces purpureus TaxID=1951 RepID=UPI000368534C|nr:hypothetical protein [Streptomyces purpureus]